MDFNPSVFPPFAQYFQRNFTHRVVVSIMQDKIKVGCSQTLKEDNMFGVSVLRYFQLVLLGMKVCQYKTADFTK
jgi:hypothetical protein